MTPIEQLDAQLKAACQVHGVSIGRWDDRSTWRIFFKNEATKAQRIAAQEVLKSFVPEAVKAPVSEIDALKAALVAKGVISESELK